MLVNGVNKRSKIRSYSGRWLSDGCDLWTLVFPIFQHFTHGKLYIFNLLQPDHFENWTPCTKGQWPFLILPFISITQYPTDIMWWLFFTPYNKRNNMTCIIIKLKHFEFSSARGGLSIGGGGICVYFSYSIYPWNYRIGTPWWIFLHRRDKNSRRSYVMYHVLLGYELLLKNAYCLRSVEWVRGLFLFPLVLGKM